MNGNRIANLKSNQRARRLANILAWQWLDGCERTLAGGGKPERLAVTGTRLVLESCVLLKRLPSPRSQRIIAAASVENAMRLLGTFRDKYAVTLRYFQELTEAERFAARQADIARTVYQPVIIAWGGGVDSTAMIVGMLARGERIDLVLFADTGAEKPSTYAFVAVFMAWLQERGIRVEIVRYQVQDTKHWPPYKTLTENCLTNGTLPSISFGFKSCSLKWNFCDTFELATQCWANGGRVIKCIGYDCSPADQKRYADVDNANDPKYEYRYPLREWGWKREDCKAAIVAAGLPCPPKSACFFCGAMKPQEVDELPLDQLRVLVLMEARATPRLEGWMNQAQLDELHVKRLEKWERKCRQAAATGKPQPKAPRRFIAGKDGVQGLWRRGTKGTRGGIRKPARVTDYIREKELLPAHEIDRIWNTAPTELIQFQAEYANGGHENPLGDWLETFNAVASIPETAGLIEAAEGRFALAA